MSLEHKYKLLTISRRSRNAFFYGLWAFLFLAKLTVAVNLVGSTLSTGWWARVGPQSNKGSEPVHFLLSGHEEISTPVDRIGSGLILRPVFFGIFFSRKRDNVMTHDIYIISPFARKQAPRVRCGKATWNSSFFIFVPSHFLIFKRRDREIAWKNR